MKRKIFGILIALAVTLGICLVMAVPVAAQEEPNPPPAPQMEQVLPGGVSTGDTWNVLKGTVDFVYDFHDMEGDLYDIDLMIYGPAPYNTKETCVDVEFRAVADPTADWDETDWAFAHFLGVTSVTYSEAEEKWTITVNLDKKFEEGETDPWAPVRSPALNVGDPVWPAGQYNFYFEVRDDVAKEYEDLNGPDDPTVIEHRWGYLNHPPAYALYVYYFHSIQAAVDAASPGDTINVADGEYAGAIVDKDVTISAATPGTPVITSGVIYKEGKTLETAFRLDAGADGAQIDHFIINCDQSANFYFGVFARGVDNVIVDSLTINNTIQGISNWGGSSWQITNNVMNDTEAAGGGGISILLGAVPPDYRTCSNNLVQGNSVLGDGATAGTYTCPGIALCLDTRYGARAELDGTEELTGNQIFNNNITVTNVTGGVGIEVGVILGDSEDDEDRHDTGLIDMLMGDAAVHDNAIMGNTIDGPWQGMFFYNVTNLEVAHNDITNCCGEGIVVDDGHSGIVIHHNNIYGNGTDEGTDYSGVYNDDTYVDYGTINAANNWWGDVAGPVRIDGGYGNPYQIHSDGDNVGGDVDYIPWLIQSELAGGWNIWSMPIAPEPESMTRLWDSLLEAGIEAVYYFDSETQLWGYDPSEANPMDAFYIKMPDQARVSYCISSDATFPAQKAMKVGWNFVGLAQLYDVDVDDALVSAYYGTGTATELCGYSQVMSPSLNGMMWQHLRDDPAEFRQMGPTCGYWVYMVNDGMLGGFTSTPVVEVPLP